MPLLKRTGQPFFPDPNSPNKISCSGEYCYPLAQGDIPYQQWYQTPCQANEVCDPTFSDYTLGAELITNGDFATNANGWFANLLEIGVNTCPTDVEGWCYDSGFVTHEAGTAHPLYQESIGLVAGTVYQVTYTVASMTAGTVQAVLGETVGSGQGSINSSNGTYTETIFYNDTDDLIAFQISEDFDGSITDVSVMSYVVTCWTGDAWTFNTTEFSACIPEATSPGNLANITTDYIVSGDYYYISVDITVTAGSIQVYIDDGLGVETNLQTAVTESGTYEYYVTASQAGVIGFKPSADFIGCISNPNVQTLKQDYLFEIVDADGNTYDISDQIQYIADTVNITTDVFAINELPYGCYTINAYDSCLIEGVELTTNGNFADGSTDWVQNNGAGQYNFSTGWVELIFEPQDTATIVTNGNFATGDFTGWTAGANWAVVGNAAVHTPGSTATLSQTVTTETPAVTPNVLFYWIQFTISGRTAGSVTVTLSDKTSIAYSTNEVITTPLVPTIGGAPVTFRFNPTSTFDGTIDDISVRASHDPWSAFPILYNTANPGFVAGNFELGFEILQKTSAAVTGVAVAIQGQTQALDYEEIVGAYTKTITGYVPGAQQVKVVGAFYSAGNYYPGRIRIDNITAHRVEPYDATFVSECLNYQLSHTNTKLITATCDQDSFGFEFANSGFKLQQRIECRSLNPVYNREVNVAKSGTGNATVKYASVEKYWQFVTGYVSESAHDALAIQISCDNFSIGDSEADAIEYVAQAEDYTPNWNTSGSYDLAPATIELRVKEGGQVFNRHT